VTAAALVVASFSAQAQTELPEIVVTTPSPVVRRPPAEPVAPVPAPASPAQALVAPAVPFHGTLPIVTNEFATVTLIPQDEILRSTATNLGDILFSKPGMTSSTFAPGASRPIIRGLDNYRVRIQENGLATNDVSDLSEDHGVPIDPLAAQRIEVIRGPATLRWGSQAIGGIVNVNNDRIPTAIPPGGLRTEFKGVGMMVDNGLEGAVLVDGGAGNFAFHADVFGRRADDYRIPGYPYLFPPDPRPIVNGRQPNSGLRSDGASVGGSYLFDSGFFGVAVSQFNSLYRIPGVEAAETNTRIDLTQTKVMSKGEFRPGGTAIDAVRFWAGFTDYKHHELATEDDIDGIHQTFTNKAQEGRVEVQLVPFDLRFAALTTAFGIQAAHQDLAAQGEGGGLFDPNNTKSVAGYVFNEFAFSNTLRMQLAGRVEHVDVKGTAAIFPDDLLPPPDKPTKVRANPSFTPVSVAVGLLKDLPGGLVGSINAQYVERAPRAPELFSRGPHEATATFEIGNPNLKIEAAKSVEVGLRRAQGPLRFEATVFYARFDGFIFKQLTGIQCGKDFASCGVEDELDQIVYSQKDATFRGAEFQSQLDIAPLATGVWGIDARYDVVRATFTDGTNVPRIPPQRVGGGLYWRDPNWFLRVGLLHAFAQTDIAAHETPTDGYNLLRAEFAFRQTFKPTDFGPKEIKIGIVGDNLLDEEIRNAVSFKKDEVLLPGHTVRFYATVLF
jgi:iron complex outermembrane receptor protein